MQRFRDPRTEGKKSRPDIPKFIVSILQSFHKQTFLGPVASPVPEENWDLIRAILIGAYI